MKPLCLIAILALAACGVDGPPVAPVAQVAPAPGVTVTGDARIGIRTDDL